MNETRMSGIIRRFDDLGRIVVPREIRKLLQLHEGDAMEISVAGNSIRLDRYQPLRFREALWGRALRLSAGTSSLPAPYATQSMCLLPG